MRLSDVSKHSNVSGSLGDRFRNRRFRFLRERLNQMPKPLRILDVGGRENYWKTKDLDLTGIEITLLNLDPVQAEHRSLVSVTGNATDLSRYAENEFDLAFSNSVIEHLYTFEDQEKMAREMQRVGRYHFVQTPNKYFIVEPHYLLPYFQFVPRRLGYSILTRTSLSRGRRWTAAEARQYLEEIRLLSQAEMTHLFPKSEIYRERVCGLNKSFTLHNLP